MRKIVISTGGGDAPGLNAVIYAVVKSAYSRGWEVYGSRSGYRGLLDFDHLVRLTAKDVEGITPTGGTIIGSTNKGNPFSMPVTNLAGEVKTVDVSNRILENFDRLGFCCHIAVGEMVAWKLPIVLPTKGCQWLGYLKQLTMTLRQRIELLVLILRCQQPLRQSTNSIRLPNHMTGLWWWKLWGVILVGLLCIQGLPEKRMLF